MAEKVVLGFVGFRLGIAERAVIEQLARRKGMKLSAYIRHLCQTEIERYNESLQLEHERSY